MKISREWATPLTIGVFTLMATTGLLMFFHLETSLQKTVHEWLGWLMVAAVLTHVAGNWASFKRHVASRGKGLIIVGVCLTVLLISFAIRPAGANEPGPFTLAYGALHRAPLPALAAVFEKSPAQARRELSTVGIVMASDDATLLSVIGGDREKMRQALAVLSKR